MSGFVVVALLLQTISIAVIGALLYRSKLHAERAQVAETRLNLVKTKMEAEIYLHKAKAAAVADMHHDTLDTYHVMLMDQPIAPQAARLNAVLKRLAEGK